MLLTPKEVHYTAEKVLTIAKAINDGKQKELPDSIFHAYERGEIYLGVNNTLVAEIDGAFKKLKSENYLLICSLGGAISVVDDYISLLYKYKIIYE